MKKDKGFTLIELMVVISIISLLSSIILASVDVAKAKANDAQKIEDAHSVQTALVSYDISKEAMPLNYLNTDGSYNSGGTGNAMAFEDTSNPTNPQTTSGQAYNASMQQLVSAGELSAIPHSPNPATPYGYYNYGQGTLSGAVFETSLAAATPSTGAANTCRPITSLVSQSGTYWTTSTYGTFYSNSFGVDSGGFYQYEEIHYTDNTYCNFKAYGTYSGSFIPNGTVSPTCPAYTSTASAHVPCDTSSSQDYCLCSQY
jgi:prepilin-type N-terminal cleavage/methylation domain-containing protein